QFEEMLDISLFPEAEERNYQTLSGFMMYRLNRIPTTTDTVDWQGYRFEVVDMDGHRVEKVLMTALTAEYGPCTLAETFRLEIVVVDIAAVEYQWRTKQNFAAIHHREFSQSARINRRIARLQVAIGYSARNLNRRITKVDS